MGMLQIDRIKVRLLAFLLVYFFEIFPIVPILTLLFYSFIHKDTIDNIISIRIFAVAYLCFFVFFIIRFKDALMKFQINIANSMYFKKYVLKGKAISKEDFHTIKDQYKTLYHALSQDESQGYCYSICFDILKCLKKGKIQFIAAKRFDEDANEDGLKYTMHVLYVNNDWCFDTYCGKQLPLEEALSRHYAKLYTSYTYNDIKDRDYDVFRKEESPALAEWCKKNDCYEKWSKFQ